MTIDLIENDKQQREQALNPAQSFIVQAPAGSGKTTLLIQRFLTLLKHVKTPEEILAITFTKKAANEMRTRIVQALKHAQHEPEPVSTHQRALWQLAKQVLAKDMQHGWHLIDNPNQLRIQTIDALCAYLTRQLPLLSHFGSQPDIASIPVVLYEEAVSELLSHVEESLPWSDAISKLLLHLDNDLNKLHDLLVNLLAKRDQWLPYIHFESNDKAIKAQLERNLGHIISKSLKSVQQLFPQELTAELWAVAEFAKHTTWQGVAKLLLTDDGQWRKQLTVKNGFPPDVPELKKRGLALINALSDKEDLRLALVELSYLPHATYQASQWEILQALLHVLKIAAAQLRVVFQLHGQIDFIENTQAAITALGNDEHPTNLALALDYQIKHILVDEFQDTSYTQYHLLEKLTTGWEPNDGRTLFVVGDPMQSIYRFREAEVGLFIRMRASGLRQVHLTPLTLGVNFRATSELVQWNNSHFHHIFPRNNDIATGAVTYNASASAKSSDTSSTINIAGFIDDTGTAQAKEIVNIINRAKNNHPNESIAILVRARQHLKEIIPLLKKAGLPYRAIEIDPLEDRQTIQDLLSLTSALIHPADRIAWLSILRAPWCGLTLSDLHMIAGENAHKTICELLKSEHIIQRLSEDGKQRIARIWPILQSKQAGRERENTRLWVESTWLAIGGPAYLNHINEMDDINAFFNLLSEFENNHEPLNITKLKLKINKLFAKATSNDAAIQVMTIHSAKGLEFDTVILPHLERKNAIDSHSLLLWMEYPLEHDQAALLLAPIHATGDENDAIYHYIYRQQRIKSDYETDRLLYVATTRAKKNLHLLFNTYKRDNGRYAIESGSLLKKLWPLIEKNADHLISTDTSSASPDAISKPIKQTLRFASNWQNPLQTKTIHQTSHYKPGGFKLIDTKAKIVGTVTHKILQQIADLGTSWWQTTDSDAQTKYITTNLRLLNFPFTEIEFGCSRVMHAISTTLNDERGQWILKKHLDARSEFAITLFSDNDIENLVIDRTFIDETNTRWIIDYKTTSIDDELDKYKEKMQQYAKALGQLDDRPLRLGLYFPSIPAWKELT